MQQRNQRRERSHVMKELIGLDIDHYEPYCTYATNDCNYGEPCSNGQMQYLHYKAEPCVLGHSSSFEKSQGREDEIQRRKSNSSTDGHKISKEGHCGGNESDKNHVSRSESQSPQAIPKAYAIT